MARAQPVLLVLLVLSLLAWMTASRAASPSAPGRAPALGARTPAPPVDAGHSLPERPSRTPPPRRRGSAARERPFLVARVRRGARVTLRSRPGGRALARLGDRTRFGSRRALAVAAERRGWLAVRAPELGNRRLGWTRQGRAALALGRTGLSVDVDRSERRIELREAGRVLLRAKAAVGRPGSSTPTGRFAVTDKLAGSRYGSYYGCCILALSGRQPNLPSGWRGGDRLAIHGTNSPAKIGRASSAGCLYAERRVLRSLMRRLPLGATVVIRP